MHGLEVWLLPLLLVIESTGIEALVPSLPVLVVVWPS